MSIITLPDNNFRAINWTLVQPTQVNRSEFTSARQVMQLPGASYWKASAEHVPIRGEVAARAWRGFFAKLRGQANTFRLIAVEGDQHSGSETARATGNVTGLTSVSNAVISGRRIERTLATSDYTGMGARSTSTIGAGLEAGCRPEAANPGMFFGIRSSLAAGTALTDYNAAWNLINGEWFTWNGSALSPKIADYASGDRCGITVDPDGSTARLFINAVEQSTLTLTPGASYYLYATLREPGAINDVSFQASSSGSTALEIAGLPTSTTLLSADQVVTVSLVGGGEQLVVLTSAVSSDSNGRAVTSVEPMIRGQVIPGAPVKTKQPTCLMAMDSSELGYSVDPGALYGVSFSATEAL